MSISNALSNAVTGLAAATRRADIVSANIANALTPGYSRRDVVVNQRILGGVGAGVSIDGISRASNPAVTTQRRTADGVAAQDQIVAQTYEAFNGALGEPDDAFSIFAQFSNLEGSLRDLAATPESIPLQDQTAAAAQSIVDELRRLTDQTQETRRSSDAAIAEGVERVNAALQTLEQVNADISSLEIAGQDASAQLDLRQQLIDEIGEYVPVREIRREFGKVDLMTEEGVFLLAGDARTLTFDGPRGMAPDQSLADGQLSRLTVDGVDITPGDAALGAREGAFAAHFKVRDEIGPEFQGQLDALARDLIERFQDIDPTLLPGDPGLFTDGGGAFDPANEIGIAGRIAVNETVAAEVWRLRDGIGAAAQGPSANSDILRTMLDSLTALRTPPTSLGLTSAVSAVEAAAGLTSLVGGARVRADNALAASNARAQALKDAELESSAVDTDAELQKLLQVEQAFAANARVIQVADQLIQQLAEI
ncbi:MAG: flagellar hook-associated protein FlgK [Pseudomonadota bacterium]